MDGNGSDGVCEGAEVATCRRELLFDSIRRIGYLLLFLIYDKIGKNTKVFKSKSIFMGCVLCSILFIKEIHYYIEETRFISRRAIRGMIHLEKLFGMI